MRKGRNIEEEESSEMDVDDEEKSDHNDESSGEDESTGEDVEDAFASSADVQNPFLDSFYGLSSEEPRERVQAGQSILQYCLLGADANSKDAAYAFRRLLNGLCSGRAAARQGNASALANFLKIAFHLNKMNEIRQEGKEAIDETASLLEFVRIRLLNATDPSQTTGKKKGSEERDYQFGRLFGILSVIRSGVLLPSDKSEETISDSLAVSSSLASDIVELFWLKKWMREPAAHAIASLLKIFCDKKSDDYCKKIAKSLVKDVVIPKIIRRADAPSSPGGGSAELFESCCAEQVGIALYIQSDGIISDPEGLPSPLNKPVLSMESIPSLAQALGETSSVVHPRMHFVWDAIWCYLTEPTTSDDAVNQGQTSQRKVRSRCLLGDDSPNDLLDALIKNVVMQQLLRLETESVESSGKATHERRSLAMCIVRNLCGVPFTSSLSGVTQILLDADSLENILLKPPVIRSLFLDVLCAGNQKSNSSHLLKPLSLNVLESMIDITVEDSDYDRNRRLSLVRSFLKCEVRFDARTRTSTVAALLNYDSNTPVAETMRKAWIDFWSDYHTWLESQFFTSLVEKGESKSTAYSTGIVELLYSLAKNILRVTSENDHDRNALKTFKETTVSHILGLLMASSFFDCSSLDVPSKSVPKKKKGKRTSKVPERSVLGYGLKLKEALGEGGVVNRDIRSIVSSRFFSLASDFVHMETHQPKGSPEAVSEKDAKTLSILTELCYDWKCLEKHGAIRYVGSPREDADKEDDGESPDPDKIIEDLRSQNDRLSKSSNKEDSSGVSKIRCCRGITILAHTLYLHRLTCDSPEDMAENDDPDMDEEDDEEEICNALEGLESVMSDFLGDNEEDENPLLGLVEICANILSSPLGSGNIGRGASPKLVREAVKFAWLGGLRLSSDLTSEKKVLFDSDVVITLLSSIGASPDEKGEDGNDSDGESDADEGASEGDDDSSSDGSSNENVFGMASELLEERNDMDIDAGAADNESDVELDSRNLQSFLEEDSDASVNPEELEHHEGADAALAKLIALKQASRKAGRQAREKIEISHQLRCTFLFEILFSRPEAWNHLFGNDVLLGMVIPLLRHRKKIEKSLDKMTDVAAKHGVGDKRALLDRLSHLIKQKLGKLKLPADAKTQDVEHHSKTVESIMDEVKRGGSKEQLSCCSMSLVFVLRSVKAVPDMISTASSLGDAVPDWSTKRTTRLQASFFDDMISHMPSLSQSILLLPLVVATQEARSYFLKAEAYRMLTLLLSSKPNPESSELEKRAMSSIHSGSMTLLGSLEKTFQDPEMRKAKRVRVVLKALEKFLPYTADGSSSSLELAKGLGSVKGLVEEIGGSESNAVKGACTKLVTEIDKAVASINAEATFAMDVADKVQTPKTPSSESTKKKKKKKKKKK